MIICWRKHWHGQQYHITLALILNILTIFSIVGPGHLAPKTSRKTSHFLLNDAMFQRCFEKNIDLDVFDDVWKKPKHRINDASNDVNRPPLLPHPSPNYHQSQKLEFCSYLCPKKCPSLLQKLACLKDWAHCPSRLFFEPFHQTAIVWCWRWLICRLT